MLLVEWILLSRGLRQQPIESLRIRLTGDDIHGGAKIGGRGLLRGQCSLGPVGDGTIAEFTQCPFQRRAQDFDVAILHRLGGIAEAIRKRTQ
jgi:hypothetical protein